MFSNVSFEEMMTNNKKWLEGQPRLVFKSSKPKDKDKDEDKQAQGRVKDEEKERKPRRGRDS
jgi:hypothetical protein